MKKEYLGRNGNIVESRNRNYTGTIEWRVFFCWFGFCFFWSGANDGVNRDIGDKTECKNSKRGQGESCPLVAWSFCQRYFTSTERDKNLRDNQLKCFHSCLTTLGGKNWAWEKLMNSIVLSEWCLKTFSNVEPAYRRNQTMHFFVP